MKLVLVCLFFSFGVLAQVHNVEVSGSTTESHAISEAEKTVLKQLLAAKGVNGDEYLKKLTQKFFDRFESYKERRLRQSYGATYQSTLTPEQKENLDKTFDKETADYYKRYLGLEALFTTQVKKKLEGDKWQVEVTENPSAFNSWYGRFESIKGNVKFLVIPHVELIGIDWDELKVSSSKPFISALWGAWDKWSKDESSGVDLTLCTDQCEKQWMSDKSADHNDLGVYFGQEDEVQLVAELRLELKKIRSLPNGESEFQFSGSYSLHDYGSRALLEAMNLGPETKRVSFNQEAQAINSQLANYFYRLGVPAFSRLKGFNNFRPFNQALQLVIEGQRNLLEIKDLEQQLKLSTASFSPRWELFALTRDTVQYKVLYRGEEKSFKELITSTSQLKSSYNAQCVWDTSSKEIKLKLVHE